MIHRCVKFVMVWAVGLVIMAMMGVSAHAGFPVSSQNQNAAYKITPDKIAFFKNADKTRADIKDPKAAGPLYKEGEVLVKYKKGADFQEVTADAASKGLEAKAKYQTMSMKKGQVYVRLRSSVKSTQQLLSELKNDPLVEWAEPNYIYSIEGNTIDAAPTDPMFNNLWGLNNYGQTGGMPDADIDAPEAWNTRTDSSSVVIAVLDTGVDYEHPDLEANMWTAGDGSHGYNAIEGTLDPMDDHSHGTHCAGTIGAAANNAIGVAGVNWTARIMALKFIAASGSGATDDAVEALDWALARKINDGVNLVAVSNSWGDVVYSQALYDMIELHGQNGIACIAAAGNDALDSDAIPHYPSSYDLDNIISVAATDHNDLLADFSNYGQTSVDLAAPGVSILSTVITQTYTPASGDLFFDDMESGVGSWVTSGTNNTWAITEEQASSPTHAWSDSPSADYQNGTSSYLEWNQAIDLSGYAGQPIAFGYSCWFDTEQGHDYIMYEFSKDGGTTWTEMNGWWSNYQQWEPYYIIIPEEFKTSTFRFRFHFYSDSATVYDGVYIDNVGIGMAVTTHGYASYNGTSMATPHVSGAYALISAEYPSATIAQKKDRLVWSGDVKPSLAEKVLSSRRLNLARAIDPGFKIPLSINEIFPTKGLSSGKSFTINGRAFESGDSVIFRDDLANEYTAIITSLTGTCIKGIAPATPEGSYWLFVRGSDGAESNPFKVCTYSSPDRFTEIFTGDNDIDNQTLTFTPNGSAGYYKVCREKADAFPTDPSTGTVVTLADDANSQAILSGGAQVSLYGVAYGDFYIGSNGYITFGAGDTDFSESLSDHFDLPRISGLFDDLNPTVGGSISWQQFSDRAVVTYQNVPEYGTTVTNSFQIEMFFNGVISLTHLNIEALDGLAGLSDGSGLTIPEACFPESDLTAYTCSKVPLGALFLLLE